MTTTLPANQSNIHNQSYPPEPMHLLRNLVDNVRRVNKWLTNQLQRVRQRLPVPYKQQKTWRPTKYTKADFIRAMTGTQGTMLRIAKNMGCDRSTVRGLLARPDWQDMRDLLAQDIKAGDEELVDLSLLALHDALKQRLDQNLSASVGKWVLSRRRKELYGDETRNTTIVEGGANPVQMAHMHVSVESLNLPVEVKRQILEAHDRKQEQDRLLEFEGVSNVKTAKPAKVINVATVPQLDND